MTTDTKSKTSSKEAPGKDAADERPADELKEAGRQLLRALTMRMLNSASGRVQGLTQRLTDEGGAGAKAAAAGAESIAEGNSPVKAGLKAGMAGAKEKTKEALGSGGGGEGKGGKKGGAKSTVIVEEFDVGLPRRVAYDQWTQFADYPDFTKKVESVEQESDEKLNWRAKIFLSHRSWESTITEQVPDERIVWKSKGAKGYVDGAVTFHELAPTITRILLVAEYHPDGFVEKTANLWRAQGRRLRLEYKNIKRHMMTRTILEQDEVEGWRGEIRDGEVVKTHEEALKEEEERGDDEARDEQGRDEDETRDESGEDEARDEGDGDEARDGEDEARGERKRGRSKAKSR
ncbi:SRPBCC family protein [Actinomadura roseirufa]|uniref:SRPBCC family protein n=1 Tax=Actinomadura roseirufa TaxID=2094049 RepID=UPI0010413CEC|nr:SRPBCC family protein [Actinomadura roseirufa]